MREAKLANEVNKKFVFFIYPHCQVVTGRQILHLLGLCITSFAPLLIVEAWGRVAVRFWTSAHLPQVQIPLLGGLQYKLPDH